MTNSREEQQQYGEMDLGEILRELYRWKWSIVGVTLLAGVLTAGYSLTKDNVYESTAALIVREPQRAIDRNTESDRPTDTVALSVETLQTLSMSTDITFSLFERLIDSGAIDLGGQDKQRLFRGFMNSLDTGLKRGQGRSGGSVELLPILMLTARSDSPEMAERVANAWAEVVEERSSEIYTNGVVALGTFIGEMYKQSNDSLVTLEKALAAQKLKASLTLSKARLNTYTNKIANLEEEIFDIDIDLAVDEVAIHEGEKRILEQQVEDEWIGTVAEDALLKNEPYPFSQESLSEQALKVLELSQQKVRQTEALRTFRRDQNLLGKEKIFAHYQLDLERILTEKAKAEDELPTIDAALAAIAAEMEDISEKIILNKAITDDALWEHHLTGDGDASKSLASLKSETLNPVYQTTRKLILELTSQAEILRASVARHEIGEASVLELTGKLESEIDTATEELDRRQTALDATKSSITLLREDFQTEKTLVEELRLKNIRSIAEGHKREEISAELMIDARILEGEISEFELTIAMLTRETEKTENVRTALASKAEEVALLEVAAENATETGTAIFFTAQANPNKVAPSRSKLVLSAMIAVFVACGFLICTAMLLRRPD